MRAHDIGIGLAVAWARRRYWYGSARMQVGAGMREIVLPFVSAHGRVSNIVDRGPVVEPVPLTDMRVAFGIAMAKCGPWWLYDHGILWNGVNDVSQHSSGTYVRIGHLVIDLDPRRWPQGRAE